VDDQQNGSISAENQEHQPPVANGEIHPEEASVESQRPLGSGPGADPLSAVAAVLLGDMRDEVLDLVRDLREPWHKLAEKQQAYTAQRVEDRCRAVITRAVNAIAARDFPAIAVILEEAAFKPKGIQLKFQTNAVDRGTRHQIVDAQGKPVLIVIGDPAAFMGARGPAKIDKQAPELPLDAAPQPNGEAKGALTEDSGFDPEGAFAEADAADLKRPGNRNPDYVAGDEGPLVIKVEDMPEPAPDPLPRRRGRPRNAGGPSSRRARR
jgi:hypothetical protein